MPRPTSASPAPPPRRAHNPAAHTERGAATSPSERGDGLHDERITVVGLLFEAEAALQRELDDDLRREAGMTLGTYEVLVRLGRSPLQRMRHTELARQLSITTGGITRLVDRLEAAGHVRRASDPSDRRGSYVQLTDAGSQALTDATSSHLASLQRHLIEPVGDQLPGLARALRNLRDSLSGDPADRIPS